MPASVKSVVSVQRLWICASLLGGRSRFLQALFADSDKTEYQTVSATERQKERLRERERGCRHNSEQELQKDTACACTHILMIRSHLQDRKLAYTAFIFMEPPCKHRSASVIAPETNLGGRLFQGLSTNVSYLSTIIKYVRKENKKIN